MNGLENEYYKEIKKNNKLVMQYEIVKKKKKTYIDFNVIHVEMNKKLVYIKNHIKNWIKPGNENEIYNFLYSIFDINKYLYGAFIAFDKNIYNGDGGIIYNENYKIFAPIVYNEKNIGLKKYNLEEYDYTSGDWEWWSFPYETKQEHMTKPFRGIVSNFDIIVHSFPIIIDDKFYGVFGYIFEYQQLNNICLSI